MKYVKGIIGITALAAILAGAGCTTTPKRTQMEIVSFSSPIEIPTNPKLTDKNNPKAYIKYCLALSECGRHEKAGDFFLEAGERFKSQRNEFSIDTYAAAASEYFYAGNMEKFRIAVLALKQTADRYQMASFDEKISKLIDLGNVMDGSKEPNEATVPSMREIYKENR